jgi:hypothetical protein
MIWDCGNRHKAERCDSAVYHAMAAQRKIVIVCLHLLCRDLDRGPISRVRSSPREDLSHVGSHVALTRLDTCLEPEYPVTVALSSSSPPPFGTAMFTRASTAFSSLFGAPPLSARPATEYSIATGHGRQKSTIARAGRCSLRESPDRHLLDPSVSYLSAGVD